MNSPSEQNPKKSAPQSSQKTDKTKGPDKSQNEARARGRGETPAANSSDPKQRSPRQENL